MLDVTLSYEPLTQVVTLTDSKAVTASTYLLVEVTVGQDILASVVGMGASARLRKDGVYKLVLQRIELLNGQQTIAAQSEIVYHLQLAGSLCREAVLYSKAIAACSSDFREALCVRYTRQKAIAAYASCNMLVADKLLKGGCGC